MIVNPEVDGYTETRKHSKTLRKAFENAKKQCTEKQNITQYRKMGARLLYLAYQGGGRFSPLPPSITSLVMTARKF